MKNGGRFVKACLIIFFFIFIIYVIKYPNKTASYYEDEGDGNDTELYEIERLYLTDVSQEINQNSTKQGNSALPTRNLTNLIDCRDKDFLTEVIQHGDYWLLKNYAKAEYVKCDESITYTTHCDFTFLNNLVPLLERWEAPVSVALYAPGDDFEATVRSILFLRNCHPQSALVQRFATFHVYFDAQFLPKKIQRSFDDVEKDFLCAELAKFPHEKTFKATNNLTYPVNVGRNLARTAALTHFVLASDIELYPNPGLVDDFFDMLQRDPDKQLSPDGVFVLPIFEVEEHQQVPRNKSELLDLFHRNLAVWFHFKICPTCHTIPKAKEWLKADDETVMKVFTSIKRQGSQVHWEPLYVGTNAEPLYNERLNWEGKSDKMTQAYIMCLLNYDFKVLSNAFLVHRPGIKSVKEAKRESLEQENLKKILDESLPAIKLFYGERKGCKVFG